MYIFPLNFLFLFAHVFFTEKYGFLLFKFELCLHALHILNIFAKKKYYHQKGPFSG